jgi:hypothetical protein
MDPAQLSDQFLKSLDEIESAKNGKWAFIEFKTKRGVETRNGLLDVCSELFVLFAGQPKPLIYEAIREALRRRGSDYKVQTYGGMVLLNLVSDTYGQVDELIDIVAPVFDLSNGEIPAFLVEQVGIEALLKKIEQRKKATDNSDISTRLNGIAYQAQVYQNRKAR